MASSKKIPSMVHRLLNVFYSDRSKTSRRLPRVCHDRYIHGCSVYFSPATGVDAALQDAAALVSWLQTNGAMTCGVQVAADSRGGLGLVASASCLAGQQLMQLPAHLQLARHSPAQDETSVSSLQALMDNIPESLWALQLGLKVLNERASQGSFWLPYIRCLPQQFSVPIFFSPSAISELHYPPVVEQVKMRSRFLLRFSQEVIPAVLQKFPPDQHPFAGKQVDAGALAWAMASVSSRAFRPLGPAHPAALLPLADMANHSPTPNALLRKADSTNDGTVQMVALKDVAKGTPVELCYGHLSNDVFLLDYGFVEEGCAHDRVGLRFQLSLLEAARTAAQVSQSGQSSHALQEALVNLRLAGPENDLLVTLGGPDHVDKRLLAAVRSMYALHGGAKLEDLKVWGDVPPLGRDVEEKTVRTLIAFCLLIEGRLPPVSYDSVGSVDVKLALAFRDEKRGIVIRALRFLTAKWEQLKSV